MKKQVEVIDMHGAKTVEKKASFITLTKRIFTITSIIWILFIAWFPLYVKSHYGEPIKKALVVSMFFDLQRNISEQYEKLLSGIKNSINLEKPIGVAIDKVKMAEMAVNKVTDTTTKAKNVTNKAAEATSKVSKLSGLAGKFGVKTEAVDNAVKSANKAVDSAKDTVNKVDSTAAMVNKQLDKVKNDLVKVSQVEIDKMIDSAIKNQIDKNSGGLGTTLLTNYGIKHVYAWRPSSWPVATKIYNDLSKSNIGVINIITSTVNSYFNYVAWGLVIAIWAIGAIVLIIAGKKVKGIISPFIVCPRCGHTFADRRTMMGLLKVFQPWKWF